MARGKKEKPIIHLHDVAKHYFMGEAVVKAVDDIDIDVYEGDFVAIMGPSGSGKSTAMNLVGSLDTPTHGHIYLDEEDISLLPESDLAQLRGQKIGFIFQQFNLIPTLTVKENVMLPMTLQGYDIEEREDRVYDLLNKVDLLDRADHYPNQISGGQQQRVAIARAVVANPRLILADEPTGNLDSKNGIEVINLLIELNKEGTTIIMVTHSERDAGYAHRIVNLFDGHIVTG